MTFTHTARFSVRTVAVVVALLLVLAAGPATVSAQEARAGGVVTIEAGETHTGDLAVTAGTVIVAGTLDGDLDATAGNVVVTGTVTGDVRAVAGSVTIDGDVGGDVGAAGGSVVVGRQAAVDGTVEAAAGSVRVDGTVGGDLRVGAEDVVIGPGARIDGNVEYEAQTFDVAPGAAVGGTIEEVDDIGFTAVPSWAGVQFGESVVPTGAFAVYGLFVNLLLGAMLLLVAPRFARRVTATGTGEAVKSGAVGLLTFVGVPVVLVVLLVTVVGIPLSLAGLFAYLLALWAGSVYGALVLGTWLLSYGDVENRWAALGLGLLLLAVVAFVPFGELLQFLVLLVGLGALVLALTRRFGDSSEGEVGVDGDEDEDSTVGSPV
jgi:cytoskeletal protein CcmA (bactofilin family)